MMCSCLESHWNPSRDGPARLSFDENHALCSAEHALAPYSEPLSVELDNNDHLAKARARNRLAQRRHRQKMKSLSNASIEQNQAKHEVVQKKPRAQSMGMHQIGHGSSEAIDDYDQAPKCDDSGHRCPEIPSNVHTSQDPLLQVVDPRSIDLGSWTPSEDIEALISSSTSASTSSSLERDKTSRGPPENNSAAVFHTQFPTINSDKFDDLCRDTAQRPQDAHTEYTYGFEAPAPVSFSQRSSTAPSNNNSHASVRLRKDKAYIPTTYNAHTRRSRTPTLPYTTSDLQTKGHQFSQAMNLYPSNALPTPPLCTPLQSSNPPSTLSDPPSFPHCAFHPPSTPVSTTSNILKINPPHATITHTPSDQLTRLSHLLDLIDAHGFDSLDALAITYYTTSFPSGHPLRAAQSLSRRRYLRQLLGALQESVGEWGEDEGRGWREGVLGGVGEILEEEVSGLRAVDGSSDNEREPRERLLKRLEVVFGDEEGRDGMREWKRVVRERATETWSLLTELGNSAGESGAVRRPGENAQIVAAFLRVLVGR
ncbi:hypothetical protein V494_01759 [Pseudogymnoascus sp. VKM F-4513 (FW-928)]|nr:hypothetical protein V494_01759 [Pseudogymnoascus sp. VKM F-4513 (FW-928)]